MSTSEIVEEVLSILSDLNGDRAMDIICSCDVQAIMKYMDKSWE